MFQFRARLASAVAACFAFALMMVLVPGCDPAGVVAGAQETDDGSDPIVDAGSLKVEPTAVDFGESGTSIDVLLMNMGRSTLTFNIASSYVSGPNAWLSISPTQGTCAAGRAVTVTLTALRDTLPAGRWTAQVTVTSGSISQTFVVSVEVVAVATSTDQVDFGSDTSSTQFDVWNAGAGTLEYEVRNVPFWLTVGGATGTSSGEHKTVTLTADRSRLSAGVYDAEFSIVPLNGLSARERP
jgi:hypothetical protein